MNSQMRRYISEVRKYPECREFCACGVGRCRPPRTRMCLPMWKLLEPHTIGILMDISPYSHDWLCTPILASLLSLENERWGWKFQASEQGLVFWWPAPSWEPSRSPPRVPSIEQRRCYHPRNSKGCRSSASGTGVKYEMLEQKMLPASLFARIWRALCQEPRDGRDQHIHIYFLLFHTGPGFLKNTCSRLKFNIPFPVLSCARLPPVPTLRLYGLSYVYSFSVVSALCSFPVPDLAAYSGSVTTTAHALQKDLRPN